MQNNENSMQLGDSSVTEVSDDVSTPDWRCSYCSHLNASSEKTCNSCAKSRNESDQNFFSTFEGSLVAPSETQPSHQSRLLVTVNRLRKMQTALFICLSVTVLCGVAAYTYSIWNTVSYKVTGVRWERSVPILRYQWVDREDWAGELRGESVQRLSERMVTHHYEKKLVGHRTETYREVEQYRSGTKRECKSGNNNDCRTIPVYSNRTIRKSHRIPIYRDVPISALKVRYRAKLYAPFQIAKATGRDNAPAWPNVKLGVGLDGKPDREEARRETYQVQLERIDSDGTAPKTLTIAPSAEKFATEYRLNDSLRFSLVDTGTVRPLSEDAPIIDSK